MAIHANNRALYDRVNALQAQRPLASKPTGCVGGAIVGYCVFGFIFFLLIMGAASLAG